MTGHLETEQGKVTLQCSPVKDHFQCTSSTPAIGAPVLLRLQSQRDGEAPGIATYRLPLKFRD